MKYLVIFLFTFGAHALELEVAPGADPHTIRLGGESLTVTCKGNEQVIMFCDCTSESGYKFMDVFGTSFSEMNDACKEIKYWSGDKKISGLLTNCRPMSELEAEKANYQGSSKLPVTIHKASLQSRRSPSSSCPDLNGQYRAAVSSNDRDRITRALRQVRQSGCQIDSKSAESQVKAGTI